MREEDAGGCSFPDTPAAAQIARKCVGRDEPEALQGGGKGGSSAVFEAGGSERESFATTSPHALSGRQQNTSLRALAEPFVFS